ncbi:family 20 glycosylhydrolase [Erwinia sp. V71]|uniref:family 20 glycosylhydrolase n=1 Tax=Erwinia sp. V71 TaxID=3369424 RepID=UPI003F64114E
MKQSKAGMLVVFMMLSFCGSTHASLGDEIRLRGSFSQRDADDSWQNNHPVLHNIIDCTVSDTRANLLISGDRARVSAEDTVVTESRGASDSMMADVAYQFQRIEILQYAHTRVAEMIPEIDMPAHARAAIMAMEARQRSFMQLGVSALMQEYLLPDAINQPGATSLLRYEHTHYPSACLDASKRYVAKAVAGFRAMHQET